MGRTVAVSDTVRGALETAVIDGCDVRLPDLDRLTYAAANRVLVRLGGRWDRAARAHVFAEDPAEAIAAVLDRGDVPQTAAARDGYFPTPAGLAFRVVTEHSDVAGLPRNARVLEPSAGTGALARAVLTVNGRVRVLCVEPDRDRAAVLAAAGKAVLVEPGTFEEFAARLGDPPSEQFDAVVMNPPFRLPGQPTVWMDHVRAAFDLLAPGARLTAILPAGLTFSGDRRHGAVRDWIKDHGGGWVDLPDEAFTPSGVNVRTVVAWMRRPAMPAAKADTLPPRVYPAGRRGWRAVNDAQGDLFAELAARRPEMLDPALAHEPTMFDGDH